MLHYQLTDFDPAAREYVLQLTVPQPDPQGQVLVMAAWTPGSYMVRDHARHITQIEASDGTGAPVALTWVDKQTWRAALCAGALHVRWRVHAHELSVRTAHLDTLWGFADAAALWLYPRGLEYLPCVVELASSSSPWARGWRALSMLEPVKVNTAGYGQYRAANVEALLDAPLAVGNVQQRAFCVRGVEHSFAWLGAVTFDETRLLHDLARACEAAAALFAEQALPFERYQFLALITADGYGGLEHAQGTALLCRLEHFPCVHDGERSAAYREFLGLCAHEYLHAWLVKRIRPAALMANAAGALPLSAEAYTRLLWLFEGFTSYYDDLLLLRAGLISLEQYLAALASTISRVQRAPGRERLTLEYASLTAWTRLYKADENTPNASISYYTKGALFAWVLDMALRERSQDQVTLDDVMRALWRDFARQGVGVPERLDAWLVQTTGVDVADVLEAGLRGCAELPLQRAAAALGLQLEFVPASELPSLGAELRAGERGEARVGTVYRGQAAERAGLAPRDELVAVNDMRIKHAQMDPLLRRHVPGDTLVLHVFRRDALLRLELTLDAPPATTARLVPQADACSASLARRARWSNL